MCVLTDFEYRDELRQRNHQEKEIVEVLELVEENDWNQRAHVVLRVVLSVCGKASRRPPALQRQRPPLPRYDASTAPSHFVAERHGIDMNLLL